MSVYLFFFRVNFPHSERFFLCCSGILIKTLADASHDHHSLSASQIVLNLVGFGATATTTVLVTMYAKKRLKQLQEEEEEVLLQWASLLFLFWPPQDLDWFAASSSGSTSTYHIPGFLDGWRVITDFSLLVLRVNYTELYLGGRWWEIKDSTANLIDIYTKKKCTVFS